MTTVGHKFVGPFISPYEPVIGIRPYELVEFPRPFPGRMVHAQNLNLFLLDTISHNIRQVMDNQLIRTSNPPGSTAFWMRL